MRVGLIGYGFIGPVHAAAWRRLGIELRVFTDPPHPAATDLTLDALLDAVDVVDICTPTDTHLPLTRAAAAAGKHVICEKPIARTLDEAAEMARACRSAGVALHIGHVVRWYPEYAAAHRAVADGRIGVPAVLRLRRAGGLPDRPWISDAERSGGVIGDFMIHDIDQARWIAGDVVRVYARTAVAGRQAYAVLTHAGGALSHLTGSWALAGGFETSFEYAGSAGLLTYDNRAVPVTADRPGLLAGPDGLPLSVGPDPFDAELGDFLTAIRGGPPPRVTPADAAATLAVTLAALESARTGRAVTPAPVPSAFDGTGW